MASRPQRRPSAPKSTTARTITRRRSTTRRPRRSKKPRGSKLPVSYNHRTHPSKIVRQPPGHCRWCGIKIFRKDGTLNLRRSWCGKVCVTNYLLRSDPAVMRQHVFFRDQGQCASCNTIWKYLNDPWEADHILPLFLAFGDWSYWEPENVQILCKDPCHKAKSKSDMARYGFVIERKNKKPVKTLKQRLAE